MTTGTSSPVKNADLGKNQHFWHKKTDFMLFHDFSASKPSSSARNEQNITLQLRQNSGETDLVTRIHQNMPKIGCFWAFSHFFCCWGPFFENFKPQICFFILYMWDEISHMTDLCHKFTKQDIDQGYFSFHRWLSCKYKSSAGTL